MLSTRVMRARPARAMLAGLAFTLSGWSLAAEAQSNGGQLPRDDEKVGTLMLKGSATASPYDLVEDSVSYERCDSDNRRRCNSYLLFVSEAPDSPAQRNGQRASGTSITYVFSVINGDVLPLRDIRIATTPRRGVTCGEAEFLEFSGDYQPRGARTVGDLFAGNVVLESLGPNQMSAMAFTCEVN